MSCFEDVVQPSSHDRPVSHRLQRLPCGRCHAAIEYSEGTDWRVVNELVNEHYEVCPMKPHAMLGHMARTPTSPPNPEIALSPPVAPEQRNSSNLAASIVGSPNNPCIPSKRRTLEQRKLGLEQDKFAKHVTAKSVVCVGCHRVISLDKRSDYYPGLWNKHKAKCRDIEKLKWARAKVVQALDDSRQTPCNVITLSCSDDSYGDAPSAGPEQYQNHEASATRQLAPHDDLEHPFRDDEEEDGNLPLKVPFPLLNCAFYEAQRQQNSSYEWTYRYSTKDEISTNLFQDQDEPYVRSISRPCALPGLGTGGCCETPRCVMVEQTVHVPAAAGQSMS